MAIDVRGYSYFTERGADKLWVATVAEYPDLRGASRIHNRALNELYAAVEAEVLRRYRAGEEIPLPPTKEPSVLDRLGLK